MANTGVTTVVEYTKAELMKSGAPAPVLTISNDGFNTPFGVALDSAGDLWVSDNAQPGEPRSVRVYEEPTPQGPGQPQIDALPPRRQGGVAPAPGWPSTPRATSGSSALAVLHLVEFAKSELARAGRSPS